jgi:peptide/nickel transport system substrate-binding protein
MTYRHSLSLGLAVILTACTPTATPANDGLETLTVLYGGDERILSPFADMPAKFLMFEPLVEEGADGRLEGRLAESWDVSPDGARVTFHLRPGMTWHDGAPVTTTDIAFTRELLGHEEVLWDTAEVAVEVIDELTVRVTTSNGAFDPLSTSDVFYPAHLLRDLDPAAFYSWDFWVRPVGNGPYRYRRHVPKTMMEFEAFAGHWQGRPAFDRLILKFGAAGSSALTELLSGSVDVLGWAAPQDVRLVASDDRFQSFLHLEEAHRVVLWNTRLPQFADSGTRRALTMAVDRRTMHEMLEIPAEVPIVDSLPIRRGPRPSSALMHAPEEARRILAEAGWRPGPDGVLQRGPTAFRFDLMVPSEEQQAAVLLREQLRRIGVDAQLRVVDVSTIRRSWRNGDFEAVMAILTQSRLQQMFGAEAVTGYSNPQTARLLAEADAVASPSRRREILELVVEHLQRDQPALVLHPVVQWIVVPAWLEGLSSPYHADPLSNMHRLRINEPLRRELGAR